MVVEQVAGVVNFSEKIEKFRLNFFFPLGREMHQNHRKSVFEMFWAIFDAFSDIFGEHLVVG